MSLSELDQLDIEDQSGVGRNNAAGAGASIAIIGRARQIGSLADAHLSDTFIPALDDFSHAKLELKGFVAITTRIELLAAHLAQIACIMDCHGLALFGEIGAVSLLRCLHRYAHVCE